METITASSVTALEAQATASSFLIDRLPDRISASTPILDGPAKIWHVPVILAYPLLGVLGRVGEVLVDANNARVVSFTPIDKMLAAATDLAEQHRDVIEAPLP